MPRFTVYQEEIARMYIENHFLFTDDGTKVPYKPAPNHGDQIKKIEYLVMHYTAGRSLAGTVDWFLNRNSQASAHLVIGRDGKIVQMVPFNIVAWHAGSSRWEGRAGLNNYSIGIELDNAGRLTKHGNKWKAWFGYMYPDKEVIEAVHKYGRQSFGWHIYPPKQIEVAIEVGNLLVNEYDLLDVVGHDDISPRVKTDPGPAFPMGSYRARVMGRKASEPVTYETTAEAPVREKAGTQFDEVPGSPVPAGTKVIILNLQLHWSKVQALDLVNGIPDIEGWVQNRLLKRKGVSLEFPFEPR